MEEVSIGGDNLKIYQILELKWIRTKDNYPK
jgi:hypothetical protein